jgi:DNA phosphorothioation-dependent restriction protein DptG
MIGLDKYPIYTVHWLDASDNTEKTLQEILTSPVRNFLVLRQTTGHLLKIDKDGVILATDIMEDGTCEVVTIPFKMLVKKVKK